MTGLIVLVAALATAESLPEAKSYADAYQMHRDEGKPLVVLVGASWCPACRTMSTQYLPEASRGGMLRDVAFAVVDVDEKRELASKLMNGSSVPQLVMYYRTADGVRRAQLTGAHDSEAIGRFIRSGLEAGSSPTSFGSVVSDRSTGERSTVSRSTASRSTANSIFATGGS